MNKENSIGDCKCLNPSDKRKIIELIDNEIDIKYEKHDKPSTPIDPSFYSDVRKLKSLANKVSIVPDCEE